MIAATVPLGVLAGALLTFMRLSGGQETTAMRAAGLDTTRLVRHLLPACGLLAVMQFALQAEVAPLSERALSRWWVRTMPATATPPRLWLHAHGEVAAIDRVSPDGRTLGGLLIVQRARNGNLAARIDAEAARYAGGRWVLHEVLVIRPDRAGGERLADLDWPNGPSPANMIELAWPAGPQSLTRLLATLEGRWSGTRGPLFYRTELDSLLVGLLDPVLMVILAAPLLVSPPRSTRHGLDALKAIGLGLGYLGLAGLLSALGGAGTLPPILAATAPMLTLGVYGLIRLAQTDQS